MSYASVRPDEWNLPLLLHVLGAMVFVGLLAAIVVIFVAGLRSDDRRAALRLAFRTLLFGAIPSYIVMRGAAEWISLGGERGGRRHLDRHRLHRHGPGPAALIAVTVLAGLGKRRVGRGTEPGRLVRPATAITLFLIAAYAVALWAMTAKPA